MCFVFQYAYSGQRVGASTTCRNRHCWISTSRSVRIATGFPEGDAKKKAATVITAEWNRDVQRNSSSPSYDRARSIATDSENLKKVSQFSFVSSPTAANTPRPSQHKKKNKSKVEQKKDRKRQPREYLGRDWFALKGENSLIISTIHDSSFILLLYFFLIFFFRSHFFSHKLRWIKISERCLLKHDSTCHRDELEEREKTNHLKFHERTLQVLRLDETF